MGIKKGKDQGPRTKASNISSTAYVQTKARKANSGNRGGYEAPIQFNKKK